MNESTGRREIESLIQGYLEESLTEDESRRLLASLRRDSSLVTTILENLRTDCLIRAVVSDIAVVEGVDQEEKTLPIPRLAEASSVGARPGRRRRHWPEVLALAACLALLVGLSVWFFGPTMGEPALAGIQGVDVSIERGTEFVPAANGMRLQSADVLRVGTNDTATIAFEGENTRIGVRAGTELKILNWGKGKRFELREGKIEAIVARQRRFKPLLVHTPRAEARVVGTKFALTVTTNRTRLDVIEGQVRLMRRSDAATLTVGAGQLAVVADATKLAALPFTGRILRESWPGISGPPPDEITMLPDYPDNPTGRDYLTSFEEAPKGKGRYGTRIRGYLYPPKSGEYRFWMASDDNAELYLSLDDSPDQKEMIVQLNFTANPRDWTKYPWQPAWPMKLEARHAYYIEVLHRNHVGTGHLAVAWQKPGGKQEIIPGAYLAPFNVEK